MHRRHPAGIPPARRHRNPPAQTSAGPQPSAAPSSASTGRLKTAHAVSAIVGAVALAAIVAGLWAAGFVPSREVAAPSPATAPETSAATQPAPNNGADLAARLDKLERTVQAQRNQPSAPDRVAAAQTQTKALSDSLVALSRRVDDIAATSQSAAKTADAAQAAAEAAKSASANASQNASQAANEAVSKAASEAASQAASQVATQVASQASGQKSDLDALASRIAALESAVKALSENAAHPAEGANDQAARLTIAAEALRAAVERGAPYQAGAGGGAIARRRAKTPLRRSNRSPQPACRHPPRSRTNWRP